MSIATYASYALHTVWRLPQYTLTCNKTRQLLVTPLLFTFCLKPLCLGDISDTEPLLMVRVLIFDVQINLL